MTTKPPVYDIEAEDIKATQKAWSPKQHAYYKEVLKVAKPGSQELADWWNDYNKLGKVKKAAKPAAKQAPASPSWTKGLKIPSPAEAALAHDAGVREEEPGFIDKLKAIPGNISEHLGLMQEHPQPSILEVLQPEGYDPLTDHISQIPMPYAAVKEDWPGQKSSLQFKLDEDRAKVQNKQAINKLISAFIPVNFEDESSAEQRFIEGRRAAAGGLDPAHQKRLDKLKSGVAGATAFGNIVGTASAMVNPLSRAGKGVADVFLQGAIDASKRQAIKEAIQPSKNLDDVLSGIVYVGASGAIPATMVAVPGFAKWAVKKGSELFKLAESKGPGVFANAIKRKMKLSGMDAPPAEAPPAATHVDQAPELRQFPDRGQTVQPEPNVSGASLEAIDKTTGKEVSGVQQTMANELTGIGEAHPKPPPEPQINTVTARPGEPVGINYKSDLTALPGKTPDEEAFAVKPSSGLQPSEVAAQPKPREYDFDITQKSSKERVMNQSTENRFDDLDNEVQESFIDLLDDDTSGLFHNKLKDKTMLKQVSGKIRHNLNIAKGRGEGVLELVKARTKDINSNPTSSEAVDIVFTDALNKFAGKELKKLPPGHPDRPAMVEAIKELIFAHEKVLSNLGQSLRASSLAQQLDPSFAVDVAERKIRNALQSEGTPIKLASWISRVRLKPYKDKIVSILNRAKKLDAIEAGEEAAPSLIEALQALDSRIGTEAPLGSMQVNDLMDNKDVVDDLLASVTGISERLDSRLLKPSKTMQMANKLDTETQALAKSLLAKIQQKLKARSMDLGAADTVALAQARKLTPTGSRVDELVTAVGQMESILRTLDESLPANVKFKAARTRNARKPGPPKPQQDMSVLVEGLSKANDDLGWQIENIQSMVVEGKISPEQAAKEASRLKSKLMGLSKKLKNGNYEKRIKTTPGDDSLRGQLKEVRDTVSAFEKEIDSLLFAESNIKGNAKDFSSVKGVSHDSDPALQDILDNLDISLGVMEGIPKITTTINGKTFSLSPEEAKLLSDSIILNSEKPNAAETISGLRYIFKLFNPASRAKDILTHGLYPVIHNSNRMIESALLGEQMPSLSAALAGRKYGIGRGARDLQLGIRSRPGLITETGKTMRRTFGRGRNLVDTGLGKAEKFTMASLSVPDAMTYYGDYTQRLYDRLKTIARDSDNLDGFNAAMQDIGGLEGLAGASKKKVLRSFKKHMTGTSLEGAQGIISAIAEASKTGTENVFENPNVFSGTLGAIKDTANKYSGAKPGKPGAGTAVLPFTQVGGSIFERQGGLIPPIQLPLTAYRAGQHFLSKNGRTYATKQALAKSVAKLGTGAALTMGLGYGLEKARPGAYYFKSGNQKADRIDELAGYKNQGVTIGNKSISMPGIGMITGPPMAGAWAAKQKGGLLNAMVDIPKAALTGAKDAFIPRPLSVAASTGKRSTEELIKYVQGVPKNELPTFANRVENKGLLDAINPFESGDLSEDPAILFVKKVKDLGFNPDTNTQNTGHWPVTIEPNPKQGGQVGFTQGRTWIGADATPDEIEGLNKQIEDTVLAYYRQQLSNKDEKQRLRIPETPEKAREMSMIMSRFVNQVVDTTRKQFVLQKRLQEQAKTGAKP